MTAAFLSFSPSQQMTATATLGVSPSEATTLQSTFTIPVSHSTEVNLKPLQDAVASALRLPPLPTRRAPTLRLAVEALKRGEQPFLPSAR